MNKILRFLILITSIGLISSCDFISNTLTYKETTENFVNSLIKEDYEQAVQYMALEHEAAKNANIDTLKSNLSGIRKAIVNNFGTKLNYTLANSEKSFSTIKGESTATNTTKAQIQYSNDKEFGVFQIIFDDHSNKILHIKILDVRREIPNMTIFWLFGLIAICIPIFNIYVIRRIKQSNMKRKWLKYIAVLFFNFPAITYSAVNGLSIDLLSFQILLGISFNYMGYFSSYWTFGIPLGGFYWLWKTNRVKKKMEVTEEKQIITEY